jgi:hypothetical protein
MRLVNIKAVLPRNRASILAVLIACSILGASQTLSASARTSAVSPDLEASLPLASTASTKAEDGIIVGTLRVGGGPPSRGRYRAGSPAPHAGVVVMSPRRLVVARTMTRTNGQFSVRIRPGHYLVAGTVSQVCPANRVVVRPGKLVSTRLTCSIK